MKTNKVKDLMTRQTCSVAPNASIVEVARLMVEQDVGSIPVVEDHKPIGIITDRDIVCRSVAKGEDPMGHRAQDYMTASVITVKEDDEFQECLSLMEEHQLRRMLVVDRQGKLCGIVSQADIARECSQRDTAELLEKVSV